MVYQLLCKRIKNIGIEPYIHLILWILFIAGEVLSVSLLTERYSPFKNYVLFYLLNIILFYSYIWSLLRLPEKNHFALIWGICIFIIALSIYLLFAGLITNVLHPITHLGKPIEIFGPKFLVSTGWRGLYFMLFATGYVLIKRHSAALEKELKGIIQIEMLQRQLTLSEKDFLRSQINPHLLFNTLSFINHATKHHPENARKALLTLSEIMDYALETSRESTVAITDEIKQIENMVQLNQLRYDNKLNLQFSFDSTCSDLKIEPLILLTLVENVFKHGNPLDKDHLTLISIQCTANSILFNTSNPTSNNTLIRGTKTGLKNISDRLLISYPGRHKFSYGMQEDIFNTSLLINF
jgi:two-component system LytT family sensor kinase